MSSVATELKVHRKRAHTSSYVNFNTLAAARFFPLLHWRSQWERGRGKVFFLGVMERDKIGMKRRKLREGSGKKKRKIDRKIGRKRDKKKER